MSAFTQLAAVGVTLMQARAYIMARVNDPVAIYNAAKTVGLTTGMLAEIAGVSSSAVKSYFNINSVDWTKLNPAKTDYVFLTDLVDGGVFLYNSVTQVGKKIYSFGRQVTDIAVDESGNIYVTDFSQLIKYDITAKSLQTLAFHNADLNSLAVSNDIVVGASATNNLLYSFNSLNGQLISALPSFGGTAAGDLAVVGNTLYKASTGQGIVSVQGQTGSVIAGSVSSDFWGMAQSPSGNLLAFSNGGNVAEINISTGVVSGMPKVSLVGLNTISGAAEAMDIHLSLFL